MLEVYLIRHGRTDGNRKGLLQGRSTNLPLDKVGRAQAQEAKEWVAKTDLHFDKVVSSPLQRAVQTAAIVSGIPESQIATDNLLLEMDYGPWEGYEMARHDPAIEAFFADFAHTPAPTGMESLAHVTDRARRFLATLGPNDGRVLIATHAILLKGALEALDSTAQGVWWSRYVGNCWVYHSVGRDGKLQPAQKVYGEEGR